MQFKQIFLAFIPSKVAKIIRIKRIRRALFPYSKNGGKMIRSDKVSIHAVLHETTELDDGVFIGDYACIGKHTYIHSGSEILCAEIGNFCSIGTNCHIGMFEHPVDNISTSSRLYLKILKDNEFYSDIPSPAKIGNDVWICSNTTILGGVKIGNGAVIGAGAVVTKDVPAYAIVCGVPARIIRYRFSNEKIERLEKIAWWNWDEEKIIKNKTFFESNKNELLEVNE